MTATYRGYISSRHLEGSCIPQRVQNLVIRDYASRESLALGFSAVEYNMPGCNMMLASLAKAQDFLGLIFYSVHQILDGSCPYRQYLEPILDSQRSIYFALESMVLKNNKDLNFLDQLICIKSISKESANRIKAFV
jgi:sporadic carbohydrate cluster protein (TIGR04323 family)